MSAPKFTPGPWYVDGTFVTNDEDLDICSMGDVAWEANAHLIAAAPELYEALDDLMDWDSSLSVCERAKRVKAAKAALAKARGEG